MNKKYKRNIAGLLAAIMVLSQAIPVVASQETEAGDSLASNSDVVVTPGDATPGDASSGDVSSGNSIIVNNSVTEFTSETGEKYVTNGEGLWITEIYQDDVNRSKLSTETARSGYDYIPIYDMKRHTQQ